MDRIGVVSGAINRVLKAKEPTDKLKNLELRELIVDRTTATISIEVDADTGRLFSEASAEERTRIQLLLGLRLRELTRRPRMTSNIGKPPGLSRRG